MKLMASQLSQVFLIVSLLSASILGNDEYSDSSEQYVYRINGKEYRVPSNERQQYDARGYGWPKQDNKWNNPTEDKWNFGMSRNRKCKTIDPSNAPNQPTNRYYQAVPTWDESRTDPNVTAYNLHKERCCQGKVYPKYPNGQYSCCGSNDYDTTRQVCCEGVVHPLQIGYECCGEKYISNVNEICCYHPDSGVTIKQLPANIQESTDARLFTQCCGDELFDSRTHVCFLVSSENHKAKNFTVVEAKYSNTGCCNGEPYDQDTQSCNQTGKIHTFISGPPCAFKQAYEKSVKRPESAVSVKQSIRNIYVAGNLSRCGNQMYDPELQICCKDEDAGIYKTWSYIPYGVCCKAELYDFKTHFCCNGHVSVGGYHYQIDCCGKLQYDTSTQWCCDTQDMGTVITRQREAHGCCGPDALLYKLTSHVCCQGQLIEIPQTNTTDKRRRYRGFSWACCEGNDANTPGQPYNSEKDICCNGIIHKDKDSFYHQCCGNEPYSRYMSICCGGKVHNTTGCCNGTDAYNETTHICCSGSVIEKISLNDDSCCQKTPYSQELQTCCVDPDSKEGLVTEKQSSNDECCSGTAYDPAKSSCCGSMFLINDTWTTLCCEDTDPQTGKPIYTAVQMKSRADRCCGSATYDRRREMCCNGIVAARAKRYSECCGTSSYEPYSQICCFGSVYDRPEDSNVKCCGKNVYDVTKAICCYGVVLPVQDVATAMCCYERTP